MILEERTVNFLSLYWLAMECILGVNLSFGEMGCLIGIGAAVSYLYTRLSNNRLVYAVTLLHFLFLSDVPVTVLAISAGVCVFCCEKQDTLFQLDAFRIFFLLMSGVSVVLLCIRGSGNAFVPLTLLMVYLFSGIELMRTLQFPEIQKDARFQIVSLCTLCGWVLISVAASLPGVMKAVKEGLLFLYDHTLYLVFRVLLFLLQWICTWIANKIGNLFSFDFHFTYPELTWTDSSEYTYLRSDTYTYTHFKDTRWLLFSVFLLLIVLVGYGLYRKYRSRTRYSYVENAVTRSLPRTVRKEERLRGRTGKIRRLYRNYLLSLIREGAERKKGNTAQMDYTEALLLHPEKKEEAEKIRDLYRKVRYDETYTPSQADCQEMKRQVHEYMKK